MSSNRQRELPRPEDRRRGDLERWLGISAAQPGWRSEAFAEDLPAAAPVLAAAPPASTRDGRRQPHRAWSFAALAQARPR